MRVAELAAAELLKPREAQLLVYCLLITKQIQVVLDRQSTPPPRLEPTPAHGTRPASVEPTNPSFSMHAALTTSPTGFATKNVKHAEPRSPSPVPGARRPSSKPPPLERTPMPRPSPAQLAALPAELAARRAEIMDRAETIDREDYFMMLDLPREASEEDVRRVFFDLAKKWHPDRLPPQIADARDACSRVFARISEAHQTLSDPERRERYMSLMKEGGATPQAQATIANVIEAATNFQKAEICLRRSDYVQAESLCRKAHLADPEQADYLAMLVWLEALKPENQSPAATTTLIPRLDKAISFNKNCERAYFYRGSLFKRLGNATMAARDFRRAVDLNPRNIDAAREVRLYEMRKKDAPGPRAVAREKADEKSGGLFGGLFKKK
jgi:tetratricopeptide (TPR) repeat protein